MDGNNLRGRTVQGIGGVGRGRGQRWARPKTVFF